MSKESNVNEIMQCDYIQIERGRRSPRPPSSGDVLMLSSTWTHSHFPKHSIEPYPSLAHPTAATFPSVYTH